MNFSTPETRANLILRLKDAEDVAAWNTFESLYAPVLYRVASRNGLQPSDAENVVQEVMLRVAKSISRWIDRIDRGPFHAWLIKIARNESIRLLSRPTTKPQAFGASSDELHWNDIAISDELAAKIDVEYQRELFLWAAQEVRETVAESTWLAFWLTHVDGLSIEDAAKQLGVKTGNIYFGRSRVMHRLKQAVQIFEEQ